MALHNFDTDLAWSKKNAGESFWETVYRQAFPDFESMTDLIGDLQKQKQGIDRVITLEGGAKIYVDEKVRKNTWTDVLLERWSSLESQRPGWIMKSLHCDFIAYAFLESKVCYFLPFQQLRRAFIQNEAKWAQRYGTVKAHNQGYTTVSVPVPMSVVMQAMWDALWTTWDTRDGLPW